MNSKYKGVNKNIGFLTSEDFSSINKMKTISQDAEAQAPLGSADENALVLPVGESLAISREIRYRCHRDSSSTFTLCEHKDV